MGDYLLFLNNVVLTAFFVPTLLKPKANVHSLTAAVYVVMIAIGAYGYALNGQWLPAIPTAFGSFAWFLMLLKGLKHSAPSTGGVVRGEGVII